MSLEKLYNKTKRRQGGQFLEFLVGAGASLGSLFLMNLLWNYLAPIWGLPNLSYLQFVSTLFLILVLKHLFSFRATVKGVYPNVQFMELIGKSPYEKQ